MLYDELRECPRDAWQDGGCREDGTAEVDSADGKQEHGSSRMVGIVTGLHWYLISEVVRRKDGRSDSGRVSA